MYQTRTAHKMYLHVHPLLTQTPSGTLKDVTNFFHICSYHHYWAGIQSHLFWWFLCSKIYCTVSQHKTVKHKWANSFQSYTFNLEVFLVYPEDGHVLLDGLSLTQWRGNRAAWNKSHSYTSGACFGQVTISDHWIWKVLHLNLVQDTSYCCPYNLSKQISEVLGFSQWLLNT